MKFELENRRAFNSMLDLAKIMNYIPTLTSSSFSNGISTRTFTKIDLHHAGTGIYFVSLYDYVIESKDEITEQFWYDFEDKGPYYVQQGNI